MSSNLQQILARFTANRHQFKPLPLVTYHHLEATDQRCGRFDWSWRVRTTRLIAWRRLQCATIHHRTSSQQFHWLQIRKCQQHH